MTNSIRKKLILTFLILLISVYYGCNSDCPVDCPVECTDINFALLQNGENILQMQPPPFPLEGIRVETVPNDPLSPPLLEINEKSFKIIACQNAEYKFILNENESINISVEIDTATVDQCCAYFLAKSVKFNGQELCPGFDECGGGIYELL